MSKSRRSIKLKDMKKEIFPCMPLSCGLGLRQTCPLQRLHIAVATPNCGISSKSRVYPLGNAPCIPPHKPYTPIIHHSPYLPDIQTTFLQAVLHGINPPLPWPPNWATASTLPYIDPLSNPVILHCLHMTELLESTFINLFIIAQLPYPWTWYFIHSPDI